MKQVRIHGRGGQGVVTAAELLAVAAFRQGKQAQAFPSFGSERMGAPVVAFCRIDDREIRSREPVAEPDALIIQDPTLLHQIDVFSGVASTGFVLINTTRTPESLSIDPILKRLPGGHVRTVPATELARQHIGRPLPNAAMLGALARMTGWISIDALCEAIEQGRVNDDDVLVFVGFGGGLTWASMVVKWVATSREERAARFNRQRRQFSYLLARWRTRFSRLSRQLGETLNRIRPQRGRMMRLRRKIDQRDLE